MIDEIERKTQRCEASVCGQCFPYVDDLAKMVRDLRAELSAAAALMDAYGCKCGCTKMRKILVRP